MLRTRLAGTEIGLLPSGAAFLPEFNTVLVADAHFGKAVSFRKLGVPVPQGTTTETLEGLTRIVKDTGAKQIVFLGDFLHSARSHAPATLDAIKRWRDDHAALQLTLVRGNHDDRAGDPPARLAIHVVDEPLMAGPFALCHYPKAREGAYVLAGHWHPCISIRGRALQRMRLPCFWLGDDTGALPQNAVGVLPAFGAFTGMHRIEPREGDRIFPVAGDVVKEIPRLPIV